jgi:RHS repeat-associated protein
VIGRTNQAGARTRRGPILVLVAFVSVSAVLLIAFTATTFAGRTRLAARPQTRRASVHTPPHLPPRPSHTERRGAQRSARASTLLAYTKLSPPASAKLALSVYRKRLSAISATPSAAIAGAGHVERYLSNYRAIVRTRRGLRVVTSDVPLRTKNAGGVALPVNLTLARTGTGFAPANPIVPAHIHQQLAGGVTVGSPGFGLIAGGNNVPGREVGDDSVFYPNIETDEDLLATPTLHGAELSTILRSVHSPTALQYTLRIPDGDTASASDDGAILITRAGRVRAVIPAAEAWDATGETVPVHAALRDDTLTITVETTHAAFPILVDPQLFVITETTAGWQFESFSDDRTGGGEEQEGELRGRITSSAPGPGSELSLGVGGEYPGRGTPCFIPQRAEEPDDCGDTRDEATWTWEGDSFFPATVPVTLTGEFQNDTFAGTGPREPEGPPYRRTTANGSLSIECFPTRERESGRGGSAEFLESEQHLTSPLVLSTSCPAQAVHRRVSLDVEAGIKLIEFEGEEIRDGFEASASISTSAIVLSETLPEDENASEELYGLNNEGEPNRYGCHLGGSINCATGNKSLAETDLEVGGRGPGLEMTRYYNSQLADSQTHSGQTPSRFGYGWTGSYSAHLQLGAGIAIVHQDNGSTVSFLEESTGAYTATSPLVQATLVKEGSEYTYTLPNQTKLFFEREGRLTRETDRNGNAITLVYEDEPCEEESHASDRPGEPEGTRAGAARPASLLHCTKPRTERLAAIEDGAGRKITLSYNEAGMVETATDPMGHVIKYEYEGEMLTGVSYPGESGPSWTFAYNGEHEITGQTDALHHTVTTEYNEAGQATSETDRAGRTRKWTYGPEDRETTITEPTGGETVVSFNPAALPTSVTISKGAAQEAKAEYSYDTSDNLRERREPNGQDTTYTYNAAGDEESETNALGHKREWTYDGTHDITSETVPNGEKTTITRDAHGNVKEVSRPTPEGTQTVKATYYPDGELETETNPLGKTTKYTYDTYGDPVSETGPAGEKQTWGYNQDSQETANTAPRGNETGAEAAEYTTSIIRDARGRPTTTTEADANGGETRRHLEYAAQFGTEGTGPGQLELPEGLAIGPHSEIWVADTKNNRIEEFNTKGELLETFGTKGAGAGQLNHPAAVALDAAGDVWVADTKNNRIEEFTAKGEYLKSVGSKGAEPGQFDAPSALAIDSEGNVWVADTKNDRVEELNAKGEYLRAFGSLGAGTGQLDNPSGIAVTAGHDVWVADTTNGRLQEFTATGEYIRTAGTKGTGLGELGHPAELSTDASGDIWVADTSDDRVDEFSPTGTFMQEFGSKGSGPAQMLNPNDVAIDPEGRAWVADTSNARIQQWVPATSRYSYGKNGLLEAITTAGGQTTHYSYNTDEQPTSVTGPKGTEEETTYNAAGEPETFVDGDGRATRYVHNVLGETTEIIGPRGETTKQGYDAAGQLETVINPEGQTTTDSYNNAGELTKTTYSDGKTPTVEYEYNESGSRKTMRDATGTTTYSYDMLNRLIKVKDGHGDTVSYEYNAANQPIKITYPNGKTVAREYDEDGRLKAVTDWLGNTTAFTYNQDSALATITFPSATHEQDTYSYGADDQVDAISFMKSGKAVESLGYTRTGDGLPATITQKGLPGEATTALSYDSRDRLATEGTTTFEYDEAGNPVKLGTVTSHFNEADELTSSGTTKYSYNANGARTTATPETGPATNYTYNQAGELLSVNREEAGATKKIEDSYSYNGDGLRASRTQNGVTSYLTWDTSGETPTLLSEGATSYVYGPDEQPIEQINSEGKVLYYHTDDNGSVRALTSSTGKVEATFSYGAYGTPVTATGTASTPLEYAGQYTEPETGLVYLRARSYDPATAQFTTRDPDEQATHEPYSYAGDTPSANVDPGGEKPLGRPGPAYGTYREREDYLFSYFSTIGLTRAGDAGVLGNLIYESGNTLSPTKNQDGDTNCIQNECGVGIYQVTSESRKKSLLAFAGHTHRHWYELPVQAEQIHNELVAEYRPLLHELRHTTSVVGAADSFGEVFENPEVFAAEPIRQDARNVYREY